MIVSSVTGLRPPTGFAAGPQLPGAAPEAGKDFAATLKQLAGDAVTTLKTGESAAIVGLGGGTPALGVVQAVIAAEQTLQAAIAIRDKAVGAYQELSRMSI